MDFHDTWYIRIFRRSVVKIQISLKYEKSNEHFIWKPMHIHGGGARGGAVGWGTALHYGAGVHSASNSNEYQECFLGVKAAVT